MTFLPFQKLSTETCDCASDSQVSLMTPLRADDRNEAQIQKEKKGKKSCAWQTLWESKCQGGKTLQVLPQRRTSRQCGWFEWKERKKGVGSHTRGQPQIGDATHLRDIKEKKNPATLQIHSGRTTGGEESHLSPGRPSCSCVSAAAQTSTRLLLLRLYLTSGHVTRRCPEGRFGTSLQRSWDLPYFACCLDDESHSLPSAAAGRHNAITHHRGGRSFSTVGWGGRGALTPWREATCVCINIF